MAGSDTYIAGALRLPIGRFMGSLSGFSAQDLGALVLGELLERLNVAGDGIDEVIGGNIIQTDPKGNPAREAALKTGLPVEVPAFTVNKNCGSSLKALSLADMCIKTGETDCVAVVGMESMSRAPHLLDGVRKGYRLGGGRVRDFLTDVLTGMGETAERLADRYAISRYRQDAFALESQRKAAEAQERGMFDAEILPVYLASSGERLLSRDEGVRADSTMENLAALKSAFIENGSVTAGNSSTLNDGAAALLVADQRACDELHLYPMARIMGSAYAGVDPLVMGLGPVPAVRKLCKKTGIRLEDIDVIELNEAFAAQSLAVIDELELDPARVNIRGGAIALGHPVGATGAIIIVKLLHIMKARNARYGLATLCIGGGQGGAILLENTD